MKHINHNSLNRVVSVIFCLVATNAVAAEDEVKKQLAQPYVTVNGIVQTNARAEIMLRDQLGRGVADSKELRDGVRDALINQSLMEQEAKKAGLDKEPLIQAQIELAQQNIFAQSWQQKVLSELTIKDDEIKTEYDKQIARLGDKEYLIRHLLVADESTAKLLIEKLQSGSKMADLAKEYSRDAATKDKGGLTDWTSLVNFLPPIAEAVPKLTKGKFTTQAVQSNLGWHILQLDDTRPFKAAALEILKPQLTQIIARRMLDARLLKLKNAAKVQ